jgi:F0F1-type ATP synthase assembly protein I
MKTTTSIKIVAATLVLLVVGCILSMLTIKNYNPFNGGFLTAVCANVCILCCEMDKKKKEDAEAKKAEANIEIND